MHTAVHTTEPMVDADTVAKHLGFSVVTIRRMAAEGRLRCHIYGLGKRSFYRFRLSEIDSPSGAPVPSEMLASQKAKHSA